MPKSYFLAAHWPARCESMEQCALRLRGYLTALAACGPPFDTWFEKGWTRKAALAKPIHAGDFQRLAKLVDRGWMRQEIPPRKIIEDGGCSISAWNGRENREAIAVRVSCGRDTKYLVNSVLLDLPREMGEWTDAGRLSQVLAATAATWQPRWGAVMSERARDFHTFDAATPFLDWMLYLCDDWLPSVPPLPPTATATRVADCGTLFVSQSAPTHLTDPAANCKVEALREALRPTGALSRTL